jgi:predicted metal-dependent hydrolase
MDCKQITLKELQEIADFICNEESIVVPKIQIKDVCCGRARYKTNKITLPMWLIQEKIEYAYYYTIHEVCHFLTKSGHNYNFKKYEEKWLNHFGLKPIYAKAYVKRLLSCDGQTLWENHIVKRPKKIKKPKTVKRTIPVFKL